MTKLNCQLNLNICGIRAGCSVLRRRQCQLRPAVTVQCAAFPLLNPFTFFTQQLRKVEACAYSNTWESFRRQFFFMPRAVVELFINVLE